MLIILLSVPMIRSVILFHFTFANISEVFQIKTVLPQMILHYVFLDKTAVNFSVFLCHSIIPCLLVHGFIVMEVGRNRSYTQKCL